MTTPYHARYFAHELTRRHAPAGDERLSMALFDACVDLNPHQIDAAAFALRNPLSKGAVLHAEATVAASLERNNRLFAEERERLEKWAEDMVIAAEKELGDTKAQIKAARRESRLATNLDGQNELQQKLAALERKQRKQRQQIFEVEDEIAEKRDALIDGLQRRMSQQTAATPLFLIRWKVM